MLASHFCDFEDLLTHDGCTGVAVLADRVPMEVQFDEHKLLFVYAHDLEPFEAILLDSGLRRDDSLKFISEAGAPLHLKTIASAAPRTTSCRRSR